MLSRKNVELFSENGIYNKYKFPIVTRHHVPMEWRYDMNPRINPYFMERIGFNAAFNSGAMKWNDKYLLVVRTEGNDRKSFFAIAESPNGIDNFRFWERLITLPETEDPDTNVYDMRLTGMGMAISTAYFVPNAKIQMLRPEIPAGAVAAAGIVRTNDLINWERLPDLVTFGGQQRNVVLMPNFINGKYAFFTRPQDGFIDTGKGGGIAFGLSDKIVGAVVNQEEIVDASLPYHLRSEKWSGTGPNQNG